MLHDLSLSEPLFIGIPGKCKQQFSLPLTQMPVMMVIIIQLDMVRLYTMSLFPMSMRMLMVEMSAFVFFVIILMESLTKCSFGDHWCIWMLHEKVHYLWGRI